MYPFGPCHHSSILLSSARLFPNKEQPVRGHLASLTSHVMSLHGLQIRANQQDRSITISGERSQPTVGEEDAKQTRNLQRLFGKFQHTIVLPKEADPQLISAK